MVKVKNLHGTSDSAPEGYGSWKEFWIAKSGRQWPRYCAVIGCLEPAMVGGHVKLVNGGNEWYIVPLCYTHNNNHDGEFYVDESLLVKVR